jgi:outer membrane protein OmpA-like peptidoglycan-associated protein
MLCLLGLLSQSALQAVENHQVGLKLGLTSIDNEDGWSFEKGSFFTDFTYDMPYTIVPRIDLGYINIDEDDKGGVSSLLQLAINGIYDVDLENYGISTNVKPYLLGGLGYEKVVDATPVFESHPFMQAGIGASYQFTDRVAFVSEFKALQIFGGSDEDNEFQLMVGVKIPLFVEVIRAPLDKNIPASNVSVQSASEYQSQPVVKEYQVVQESQAVTSGQVPTIIQGYETSGQEEQVVQEYQAPVASVGDKDGDGVDDSIDKCPHTPKGISVDESGCTVINNSVVIPEEVSYVDDSSSKSSEVKQTRVLANSSSVKRKDLKVSFESSSAAIKGSKASIKQFASYLKNNPSLTVTIEGYTDNSGQRAKNLALSTKRAKTVAALLVKYGVSASRIKAIGKGDLNPIADNETESGRRQNRRIEAVIK